MRTLSPVFTVATVLLSTVNAAPQLQARALTKPSDDPFYKPPADFADKPLGTILKSRESPNDPGFLFFKQDIARSQQILYRTSNSSGGPVATVATIYTPHNGDPSKLLAYSTAEDASYINCAPSYALQAGSSISGVNTQFEIAAIDAALNQGWYVVTSDYEGPQGAFTAGYQAGHAVLDSIRATLNNPDSTGVHSDAKVTLWGYSGGSLATAWASELQQEYYSELEIAGVAMGGLVPNITAVTLKNRFNLGNGLVPLGIQGLSNEYPEFRAEVDRQLKPELKWVFYSHQKGCLLESVISYLLQDWTFFFKDGIKVLNNPIFKKILNQNSQGHHIPKAPYMVYHSINDEVAPVAAANAWYDDFCSKGVNIEYNRDELAEHVLEGIFGIPMSITWLKDRYDGKPVAQGCKLNKSSSNLLTRDSLKILPETVISLLLDLFLRFPLGPQGVW